MITLLIAAIKNFAFGTELVSLAHLLVTKSVKMSGLLMTVTWTNANLNVKVNLRFMYMYICV